MVCSGIAATQLDIGTFGQQASHFFIELVDQFFPLRNRRHPRDCGDISDRTTRIGRVSAPEPVPAVP